MTLRNQQLSPDEKSALLFMQRAQLARTDVWNYLKYFVYTHDEHDKDAPVKAFPRLLMYRIIVRAYEEHHVLFIEKSRQIMMSWLFAAIFLHDILFYKHRRIAFQSREDDSASALVQRAEFIYEQLIARGFPDLPEPKWVNGKVGTENKLKIPSNNSVIIAVPRGEKVFRSYTFSGLLSDEIAHQEYPEKTYKAAYPTTGRTGHYVAVGTPNGKVFNYQMMYGIDERTGRQAGVKVVDSYDITRERYSEDQLLSMSKEEFYSIPFEEVVACAPGMRFWIMKMGDFETPCLRVHYSADPNKRPGTDRGDRWISEEKKGCPPSVWEQEYEISYETYAGRKVITNWSRSIFVKGEANCDQKELVQISCDFGTKVCCALFGQYNKLPDFNFYQAVLFHEIVLRDSNTVALANEIERILRNYYPKIWREHNFVIHPDPAGYQKKSNTSEKSLQTDIGILRAKGFPIRSKKLAVGESTELVETVFAMSSPEGHPAVIIHPRCEYHIGALEGGWRYPDIEIGKLGRVPEKDGEWDHAGDDVRHLLANMFDVKHLVGKVYAPPVTPLVKVRNPVTGQIVGMKRQNHGRRNVYVR